MTIPPNTTADREVKHIVINQIVIAIRVTMKKTMTILMKVTMTMVMTITVMMTMIMIMMKTEFDHISKLPEVRDEKCFSTHRLLNTLLRVWNCCLSCLIYYLKHVSALTQDFADFSGLCVSQSYLLLNEVF